MRLLVLGGTAFLGRSLVEEALRRGHAVTTFNRGRTGRTCAGLDAEKERRILDAVTAGR
jgi:2'-hydroxyisoflavone reductase